MAQEQNHSSSGGCTNGVARSSKKFKQNKVPQRGLGVAQLEKIRLEEQQISPSNSSSCLASPTDHPSSSKPFTPPSIIQRSTDVRPNSISELVSNNGGECRMGWQGISSAGRGSWPNSLNDEYNLGGGIGHKVDHQVSNALLSSVRSQPFHGTCPSSMVNVSVGNSSSSVTNFWTEPPSNQSHRSNKSQPLWPDEEMMIGLKRSYPFSVDDAPVPAFNCKFPPAYLSDIPTTDASASFKNDGTFAFEQANPVLREDSSGTGGVPKYKKKIIKENGGYNGDFLTLAPPIPKDPPSYLGYYIPELPDFDALPYQGGQDNLVHWPRQIPSVEHNGQSMLTISHSSDVVESVDLNLKL
ncbi:hypothetical protein DCAR_0625319 [Daucus carota subsp. sativus]|uniref:Uncharacterized protein n=1 Tax=Daucus carota subsp. sativus TaxID=79200 RepID=A0A161XFG9_DAUCS|nr:PREDICTED: uncharacterized protein LOC108224568 isoform X2 [Daucus carota subsp. sativus]WOH05896.1 hypothetical protein DCAR_0625319 [Daucus carota subsp. sativus]